MKKLIVNADDFGYNEKINQGIINAHKDGIVTSTSLMTTREGFDNAVNLAKDNPRLSLGIHLDLDSMFDIDHTRGRIIGFRQYSLDKNVIESQIKQQFDTIFSKGLIPDHLTGHHHVHMVKEVFEILVPLMKQYKIPSIRFHRKISYDLNIFDEQKKLLDTNNIVYAPHFIEGWYWGNIDEPFTVAELMTHPGYGELWREYELLASCDIKLKNYLREKNVQLITYTELVEELKLKSN